MEVKKCLQRNDFMTKILTVFITFSICMINLKTLIFYNPGHFVLIVVIRSTKTCFLGNVIILVSFYRKSHGIDHEQLTS